MNDVLDPRWEWIDVGALSVPGPVYIRGACRHIDVIPVETLTFAWAPEIVAHLCLTCDVQLPDGRS